MSSGHRRTISSLSEALLSWSGFRDKASGFSMEHPGR